MRITVTDSKAKCYECKYPLHIDGAVYCIMCGSKLILEEQKSETGKTI